jgi:hypothetical protein
MKWNTIEDRNAPRKYLPMDGETFLAIWKGQFCLSCYDDEEDCFWLQMLPGTYSGDMKLIKEREYKFTHWCKLEYPLDY